jgi:hypothetical protein
MRAVSFVERLEFECPGSVFKNAIALGDVDNDSAMELVVGSDCGEVLIFKGSSGVKCWRKACDLGMVYSLLLYILFTILITKIYYLTGDCCRHWGHIQ